MFFCQEALLAPRRTIPPAAKQKTPSPKKEKVLLGIEPSYPESFNRKSESGVLTDILEDLFSLRDILSV
jgi:hypothetical protein